MGLFTCNSAQTTMRNTFTPNDAPPMPPPAYIPVQNNSAYNKHTTLRHDYPLLPNTNYQSHPMLDSNGGYWGYIAPGRKRRRELKRSEKLCCGAFWFIIFVVIIWGIYWGSTREARECVNGSLTWCRKGNVCNAECRNVQYGRVHEESRRRNCTLLQEKSTTEFEHAKVVSLWWWVWTYYIHELWCGLGGDHDAIISTR